MPNNLRKHGLAALLAAATAWGLAACSGAPDGD